MTLLMENGIRVPEFRVATNVEDAVKFAKEFGTQYFRFIFDFSGSLIRPTLCGQMTIKTHVWGFLFRLLARHRTVLLVSTSAKI